LRIAGPLGTPSLQFDAADRAMIEVSAKLPQLLVGASDEGATAGAADLQRREIGEHPEHRRDIRVQRAAIGNRQIQREIVGACPRADYLRVRGQKDGRRRQTGCGRLEP